MVTGNRVSLILMALKHIIDLVANKMGLNSEDANQRQVLLRFINEAAYEIYNQCDPAGSVMEQVFRVNGDQTVSLPSYVGPLRAIREYSSFIPWSLNQMRPRYNQSNWNDFWRNWRLKGMFALEKSVTNQSQMVVTVPVVENPPITVTVSGSTAQAAYVSETLTMSAVNNSTTNLFTDVKAFIKSKNTLYDVSLTDIDGNLLSVIPSNELSAKYQIVDVSTCPWLQFTTSTLDHFVEVLYKKALPVFQFDGDEFPAFNYDFIISNKAMQIWSQEQGQVQQALAYDQMTTRSLARRLEEENRATEDCVAFVENTHDLLNPRIRARRPARYGGYSTTTRYGVMAPDFHPCYL